MYSFAAPKTMFVYNTPWFQDVLKQLETFLELNLIITCLHDVN